MHIRFIYATVFLFCMLMAGRVEATTILVGKNHPVKTVTQGIELAKDYDTVLVEAGTYREGNIFIGKPISLIGIDYPVLDGENKEGVVTVNAVDATVKGFKIIRSGRSEINDIAGIRVYNSRNVTVEKNILDDNNFGIFTQHSVSCTIKDNEIKAYGKREVQSGNGIHIWRADSMLVIGNKIEGHRDGIYFEFVKYSLIWRNVSTRNLRYGIHFMFSHYDTYIANIFSENASGVAVMYTSNIHMYNNHFLNNWGDAAYGILLKEISDSDISGNFFTRNTVGIVMEGCSRINMHKNAFYNNGWAIKITASSDNNVLTKNNFKGNTFDISTNGSLVLNEFNGNYWDKYEGYDLNRDRVGDVPYRPVSMYSMIIDENPAALMLFRSLIVSLLDKSEKLLPGIIPEQLKDDRPLMQPLKL